VKTDKHTVLSFKIVPVVIKVFTSAGLDIIFQYFSLALPWLATQSSFSGTSKLCMASHIITNFSTAVMLPLGHWFKP
jgi:hypothetical protein